MEKTDARPLLDSFAAVRLPVWRTALLALLLLANLMILPLSDQPWMKYVSPFVAVLSALMLTFRFKNWITVLLVWGPPVLIGLFMSTPLYASLYVAFVFVTGAGTFLALALKDKAPWLFLLPLCAVGLTLPFSTSPYVWMWCLLFVPPAVGLYVAVRTQTPRVGSILCVAVPFLLTLTGLLLITFYQAKGTLSVEAIASYLEQTRDSLFGRLKEALTASLPKDESSMVNPAMVETYLKQASSQLIGQLPGLVIAGTLVIGWIIQPLPYLQLFRENPQAKVPRNALRFQISPMGAAVFLVCLVVSLFTEADSSADLIFSNLKLILTPGLMIVGFFTLLSVLHIRIRWETFPLVYILLLFSCCCVSMVLFSNLLPSLLAVFGAVHILRSWFVSTILKPGGQGPRNPPV
ncbi:MAG: hypothetical protein IJU20_02680 [Clostridia bacterium]|nr:hypothetical protein [Clostridia bacterium]